MVTVPKLLVSVRDPREARVAMEAGVEILDVKEPDRGSLGMPAANQLRAVLDAVGDFSRDIPISVACGEVAEWIDADAVRLPQEIRYAKLGLAGLAREGNWQRTWASIRSEKIRFTSGQSEWIAVAYADWREADAPPPHDVIRAAGELQCAGVLFDTWSKQSGRFFDAISDSELCRFAQAIHSGGMLCAVAGRLRSSDLARLRKCPIDVIAVRSAACLDENRNGPVCPFAIRNLKRLLAGETSPVT